MKKTIFAAVVFIVIFSMSSFAQKNDRKDVLAVVNKMFAEMANHNPPAIAALFTENSNLAAVIKNKDGKSIVRTFTGETFSKNFAEKKSEIEEIMYQPKTEIFGDLAIIWGRYVFYNDGRISHCGVNSFHLVRIESVWKIANASSTIEPLGCTEKEKSLKNLKPTR